MKCRSSECGREIDEPGHAFCSECERLVWAYESREGEPHFIGPHEPDGHGETEIEIAVEHFGEQCDNCGNSRYVVGHYASGSITAGLAAVCSDMEIDGEHFPGCGAKYPIVLRPSREVIF